MRSEPARDTSFIKGLAILFVDDSPDERELFELRLGSLEAEVTTVESVVEALDVMELGSTEVVVTDLMIPYQSGYDLIRTMRDREPERGGAIPAVAVSGLVEPGEVVDLATAGFNGFLEKPYTTGELVAALKYVSPRIAELRQLRGDLKVQVSEQRALRDKLAGRRRQLHVEHALFVAKHAPPSLREAATRDLVRLTAQEFGESFFGAPVDSVDVASTAQLDDVRGKWLVVLLSRGRLLVLEIRLNARYVASIYIVDGS
jgi:CheY-like chemotaxis protein